GNTYASVRCSSSGYQCLACLSAVRISEASAASRMLNYSPAGSSLAYFLPLCARTLQAIPPNANRGALGENMKHSIANSSSYDISCCLTSTPYFGNILNTASPSSG